MTTRTGSRTAYTTTNTYADASGPFSGEGVTTMNVVVKNTGGSNAADLKLQGALYDTGDWFDIDTSAALAAAGLDNLVSTVYWPRYRVVAKATSGGSQTTVQMLGAAGTGR